MDGAARANEAQITHWNGLAGQSWAEAQALLDGMLQPFEDHLVAAVRAAPGTRVLDIGCGTGAVTLAVAAALGPEARCLGVDISEPMLARARERANAAGAPVTFVHGDAETHDFEPGGFDRIVSRFGVMFFEDPVRAFANIGRAAAPGAALSFVAWRSPRENAFMTAAVRAAKHLLPPLPPYVPDAPGQFGFADGDRVRRILAESGWADVAVRPIDVPCTLERRDLMRYVMRFGPLGAALEDADEATRAGVAGVLEPAYADFVEGETVRFTAACWSVDARRPA